MDCFEAQFAASLLGNVFSEHGKVYNSNPEINNMCCYSFIRSVDFLKTQLVASRDDFLWRMDAACELN